MPKDKGWLAPLPADQRQPWETGEAYRARIGSGAAQNRPVAPASTPAPRTGWISTEGRVRAETDKAVIVRIDGRRDGVFPFTDMVFPRSVCEIEIKNGLALIAMPPWFAAKKGFQ